MPMSLDEKNKLIAEFESRIIKYSSKWEIELTKDELEFAQNSDSDFIRRMYLYATGNQNCMSVNQFVYVYKAYKNHKEAASFGIPKCNYDISNMFDSQDFTEMPIIIVEWFTAIGKNKKKYTKYIAKTGEYTVNFFYNNVTNDMQKGKIYYITGHKSPYRQYNELGQVTQYGLKISEVMMKSRNEYPVRDIPDIKISALVYRDLDGRCHNRIVLSKKINGTEYKEARINCTHTAICDTTINNMDEDIHFAMKSSELREVNIVLEEHMFALDSYVQVIAEAGLLKLFRESFNYNELNFGMNSAMIQQFIYALARIDKNLGKEVLNEFFFNVLTDKNYNGRLWIEKTSGLIENRFNIIINEIHDDFVSYEFFWNW